MGDIYTNPPQSRNEAILRATIDGTEYTAPPQSRIEDLLLELKEAIEGGGGAGGMSKSVYDPDDTVADAGGISAYVGDEITDLQLGTASKKNSTAVVTQSTDLVESGAVKELAGWGNKNLLPNNAQSTGIFTVNADKSVTINGSSGSSFKQLELDMDIPVNIGTEYILSDGVSEPNNNVYVRLGKANDSYYGSTGTGDFRFTSTESKVTAKVFVSANQTVDNLTLKPMLRLASVTDPTYEPYHASVADSLEEKADNTAIAPTENGTNPTKSYSVGEHMKRGRKFCTVTSPVTTSSTWTLGSNYVEGAVGDYINAVYYRESAITVNANSFSDTINIPEITGYKPINCIPIISGTGAAMNAQIKPTSDNDHNLTGFRIINIDSESHSWYISSLIVTYVKADTLVTQTF